MRTRLMYAVTRARFRNARNSRLYACLVSRTAGRVHATGARDQQTVTMESVVVFGEA